MRTFCVLALAALLAAAPAAAQHDHGAAGDGPMATSEGVPEGWLMRFDRANAGPDMVDFSVMAPGWHITTGPIGWGIFWKRGMTAAGEYRAATSLHLMQPASHPESFGLFVGGRNLGMEDQAYLYFMVRQNGQYLIKRRRGADTEDVVAWTAHEAVPTARADGSTRYDLAVDVGATTVDFVVNGITVHSLPGARLSTDGVVGLRIGHRLDVHVETLSVDR